MTNDDHPYDEEHWMELCDQLAKLTASFRAQAHMKLNTDTTTKEN
jgi:hypothetical protein